jgi:hypothetical protein
MTVLLWLLAHSVALLCHEFSHSFVAWFLRWKSNPLALNWGSSSPMNLLMQVDIDENVNYEPIFSQGHPYQAGIISLAGMGLGNAVISLGTGLGLFSFARKRGRAALGFFAYWLTVMSLGNLISYVPMRVFTWHADMHTVAIGFGWTQTQLLLLLGIPILVSLMWFLLRFEPYALGVLVPESMVRRSVLVVLTSLSFFGWFSSAGLSCHGELSHKISLAFVSVLGPASIVLGLVLTRRRHISANAE